MVQRRARDLAVAPAVEGAVIVTDALLASDKIREYAELLRLTDPPDLRLWLASSEAEFCEAVEDGLHRAIFEMESGRKHYMQLPEPALSKMLCSLMKAARIPTTAEEDSSGHVDVTVKHGNGIYVVLGECKKYRSYSYHLGGCRQLLKRYSAGRSRRTFCLEFFCVPEMYEHLSNLRGELDRERPLKQQDAACNHPVIRGAFITAHKHSSASIVEVLHLGCNLHHEEAEAAKSKRRTATSVSKTPASRRKRRGQSK